MKSTINKFDYPTAASHTYKMYKLEQPKPEQQAHKQRYKDFVKEQRDLERMKAKQEQQRKLQAERRENKKKIQEEIENKKRQLEGLERARNLALEAEKKSQEMALIRQEEERLMKIEQQRRAKENQYNAQNRFMEALKRLEMDNQIKDKKKKEAQLRRKVVEETEKIERGKAIVYRAAVEEKQKQIIPDEKRTFKDYKQPLGRTAFSKNVDYSKTYIHNPIIIIPESQTQQSAIEKAQKFNNREAGLSSQRKQKEAENRRASMERGQKAMDKLKLQKQFEEYQREAEARAIQYNMERIQLGKKNQYVGMKPVTLAQMEANKKQRGEQEFEQMFFGGSNPEWFDRPATRYQILGARADQIDSGNKNDDVQIKKKKKIPKSLGSLEPAISDSHYSFEEGSLNNLTSVKKMNEDEGDDKGGLNPIKQYEERHEQSEDRGNIQASHNRQELSYSESEDSFV